MDVVFWEDRVTSAKHISAVQTTSHSNSDQTDAHSNMDIEVEEDVRAWFPCPFCNVEIEVQKLCSHLQDEHCFDLKNAVCPICAASLGIDPTGHFTLQHALSVKRRRKYQKSGFWNNATRIDKDPQEITSFFSKNSVVGRCNGQEPAPDPLLMTFLCNVPPPDTKNGQQGKTASCVAATTDVESSKLFGPDPAVEEDYGEKRQRAMFIQELIASAIF